MNYALRRLDFQPDVHTCHGFRASASSLLNESGKWHPDAIEAELAHVGDDHVRKAYHRATYWDERVRMAEWWAAEVMKFAAKQKRKRRTYRNLLIIRMMWHDHSQEKRSALNELTSWLSAPILRQRVRSDLNVDGHRPATASRSKINPNTDLFISVSSPATDGLPQRRLHRRQS
jgi:hypothetical protein